jgi:integrase
LVRVIIGWRVPSEVQPLHWHQVDFTVGTVRLDPGQTKNGDGRLFPMTTELRTILEDQRAYTDRVQRNEGALVPHVFDRNGKPITAFTKAWKTACIAAGCPDRIPHDLRRTAVRNLVRSGVPERVAMQMTGHKTRPVFERYNIVCEADLFGAAQRYENGQRDSFVTVRTSSATASRQNSGNS